MGINKWHKLCPKGPNCSQCPELPSLAAMSGKIQVQREESKAALQRRAKMEGASRQPSRNYESSEELAGSQSEEVDSLTRRGFTMPGATPYQARRMGSVAESNTVTTT